jgi:hypothetical protein
MVPVYEDAPLTENRHVAYTDITVQDSIELECIPVSFEYIMSIAADRLGCTHNQRIAHSLDDLTRARRFLAMISKTSR